MASAQLVDINSKRCLRTRKWLKLNFGVSSTLKISLKGRQLLVLYMMFKIETNLNTKAYLSENINL